MIVLKCKKFNFATQLVGEPKKMLNKYLHIGIALTLMFAPISGVSANAQEKAEQMYRQTESQAAVNPDIADLMEIKWDDDGYGCVWIPPYGWVCN